MDGVICVVSLKKKDLGLITFNWKQNFEFQQNSLIRTMNEKSFIIEQKTSQRFLAEKHWIDNESFIFVTDGVILNFEELKKRENAKTNAELVSLLASRKKTFFEEFEGSFVGLYYDKHSENWFVFNNQTGTKKLYYFKNDDYLVFSTDLYVLCKALLSLHITYTLDELAAYILLTGGFMLDNLTLVSEVKQLRAGEFFRSNESQLLTNFYFHLQHVEKTTDSKSDILRNLEELFNKAVKLEFDIDTKYGYKHVSTLSGGLDSRMTSFVAHKLGYEDLALFCFSEKGYADEIIAKQLTKAYNLDLTFKEIEPNSLTEIDNVILVNDGLTVYTACSHVFNAIKDTSFNNIGCVHTGLIGDGALGSYLTDIKEKKANLQDGLFGSTIKYPQVKNYIGKLIDKYPNEELYKIYNRAFMGINNGLLYLDLIGHTTSPFLNTAFLSYSYSIPTKLKYKQAIYIDWLKSYHPDLSRFTWEAIGGKATNSSLLRSLYRVNRAIIKRLPIKTMWKHNMNPEQVWYDKNKFVRDELDNYMRTSIDCIKDSQLRNSVMQQYGEKDILEKAKSITLAGAIKLLFQ